MADFEGYPKSFEELRRLLRSEYDDRYVKQTSCAERHEELERNISEMKIAHTENSTKLDNVAKWQWWELTLAGSTLVAMIAGAIGFAIFKS